MITKEVKKLCKNLCKDLKEHAVKIVNCETLEMLAPTRTEKKIILQTVLLSYMQK